MRFKRTLIAWHFFGALVIMSLASIWHFFYSWTPNNVAAAIFPVNESIWEQVKLFLVPSVIFYIIEYLAIGKKFRNYIFAHGLTLLIMPVLMLVMVYFYRNSIGLERNLLIEIIITFVSICIGLYAGYKVTIRNRKVGYRIIAFIIAGVLFVSYGILTFLPPKKPMFRDPETYRYGTDGFYDRTNKYDNIFFIDDSYDFPLQ